MLNKLDETIKFYSELNATQDDKKKVVIDSLRKLQSFYHRIISLSEELDTERKDFQSFLEVKLMNLSVKYKFMTPN